MDTADVISNFNDQLCGRFAIAKLSVCTEQ